MIYDVAIVGGGVAGLSCAYALVHLGRAVLVLEQQAQWGAEASGKNAAMIRQCVTEPTFAQHAAAGARWFAAPPSDVADRSLVRPCGSLIRYPAGAAKVIGDILQRNATFGATSTLVRPAEAAVRSAFAAHWHDGVIVWTPSDGVVDLPGYIRGIVHAITARGGVALTSAPVTAIRGPEPTWALDTPRATYRARCVVNAAGAWADPLAQLAGVAPRGLTPLRRHVMVTAPDSAVDADGPFVWDDQQQFYSRPCDGGVMWCACDEVVSTPGDAAVDDMAVARIRHYITEHFPAHAAAATARSWSGQRTFSTDRHLQMGADAATPRWFWLAGLGGHGVTCGPSVGQTLANQIHETLICDV